MGWVILSVMIGVLAWLLIVGFILLLFAGGAKRMPRPPRWGEAEYPDPDDAMR